MYIFKWKNGCIMFLKVLSCLFLFFMLWGCSEYPEMDADVLAQHIYAQNPIELTGSNKEYISMVAKSFGLKDKQVLELQEHILSKKTIDKLKEDYENKLRKKVFELEQRKVKISSRNDFVINVFAPYLDNISRNQIYKSGLETEAFETKVCGLYEKFFPTENAAQSLREFFNASRIYFSGESFNVDYLNAINMNLLKYGLFIDYELQSMASVLKVQDTLLPMVSYKGDSLSIIKLKRFIPGLMPSKKGYFVIGMRYIIVLEDMIAAQAEADSLELEKGDLYRKYGDKRYEIFWKYLGLSQNLAKAGEIYNTLMKKDFGGKSKAYIKRIEEINTAIHEAKHIVDQIEHPELTLNLDAEFSAHVTEAIYSPAPNVALLEAIQRMEKYAMYQRQPYLNDVVYKMWMIADRSAYDKQYTNDSLRVDLMHLYESYRTIRENAYFEPLDEFYEKIVSKL